MALKSWVTGGWKNPTYRDPIPPLTTGFPAHPVAGFPSTLRKINGDTLGDMAPLTVSTNLNLQVPLESCEGPHPTDTLMLFELFESSKTVMQKKCVDSPFEKFWTCKQVWNLFSNESAGTLE